LNSLRYVAIIVWLDFLNSTTWIAKVVKKEPTKKIMSRQQNATIARVVILRPTFNWQHVQFARKVGLNPVEALVVHNVAKDFMPKAKGLRLAVNVKMVNLQLIWAMTPVFLVRQDGRIPTTRHFVRRARKDDTVQS
jgi:hypothetical protein